MHPHLEMVFDATNALALGDERTALELTERLRRPEHLEGAPEERLAHAFGFARRRG